MKITISQEGSEPVVIDSNNIQSKSTEGCNPSQIKSQEDDNFNTPGKIYNAARLAAATANTVANSSYKQLVKHINKSAMDTAKAEATQKFGNFGKRMFNEAARLGFKSSIEESAKRAVISPKVLVSKAARTAAQAANPKLSPNQILAGGALGITNNVVMKYFLTGILGPTLAATVYNSITSIGNFNSGAEFLRSNAFLDRLNSKVRNKYRNFPTVDEVKKSTTAKTKSGFLAWILGGGQASGDKVKNIEGTTKFMMKDINGIPVAVTQLMPLLGSMDAKQLFGKRVIIATAFVFSGTADEIKSIPICRGYLKSGLLHKNYVNPDAHTDKGYESGSVIMGYYSYESESPTFTDDVNEFMSIFEEDDVE